MSRSRVVEDPSRSRGLRHRAARLVAPGLLAVAVTALVMLGAPGGASAQEVSLPLGSPAPSATLQDLDGNAVQLLDYVKGKPALIEFWATWCENCAALQPQLDEIAKADGERIDIVAVAVAVAQSARRVKRQVAKHDPGYPYLWDAEGAAVRAYQAATTSVVVILDAEGKVAYTGVGPDQDLKAAVASVLGS